MTRGRSQTSRPSAEASAELLRARDAYTRRAWADAYLSFVRADEVERLGAEDAERCGLAAGMIGRDHELIRWFERLHHLQLDAGHELRAARAAFWCGFRLFGIGEPAKATGWLERAHRLTADHPDSAEHGFLKIPAAYRAIGAGDLAAGKAAAKEAEEVGRRTGERDLEALGRMLHGRVLLLERDVEHGLRLLDEVMVGVTGGELTPVVAGVIYCSVIDLCRKVYAYERAAEWTTALSRWCDDQPQLVTFTGQCHAHRSEVMQIHGEWPEAMEEARLASGDASAADPDAAGRGLYQSGEIHRLRGDLAEAEAAYRAASQKGREPQPGLALMRLAQGDRDAAVAAIRRVIAGATLPLDRARLLPAYVDIMLETGDLDAARKGSEELAEIANAFDSLVLDAIAAHARGAVLLAAGDPQSALEPLRRCFETWQQVGAPYLAARLRVLVGRACMALGDRDGAELEFSAAREVFESLGARPDLAAMDESQPPAHADSPLTARELEVLRLVAAGKTNKAIANQLHLSEKTIDRHVSNIFNKLDVRTRAAATAYAYEHKLV